MAFWTIPLAVMLIAFWRASSVANNSGGGIGNGIVTIFYLGGALIVSLLAWLIYFIII